MARGIGEAELAASLPDWAVAVAGVVTQLGDMWFVLAAAGLLYVVARRREGLSDAPGRDCAALVGLALGAYSLTVLLKAVFGLPRPPGAGAAAAPGWLPTAASGLYEGLTTAEGYGFPSGHALKTTAVYGGGAALLSVWDRRRRVAVAAVVVALVAASRVVLGVHYLVDVVVGVAVGAAFCWAVLRLAGFEAIPQVSVDARGRVDAVALPAVRVLALGCVLGVAALVLAGSVRAGLAAVLAGLGAAALWVRDPIDGRRVDGV